jgi:hypothetical protein
LVLGTILLKELEKIRVGGRKELEEKNEIGENV